MRWAARTRSVRAPAATNNWGEVPPAAASGELAALVHTAAHGQADLRCGARRPRVGPPAAIGRPVVRPSRPARPPGTGAGRTLPPTGRRGCAIGETAPSAGLDPSRGRVVSRAGARPPSRVRSRRRTALDVCARVRPIPFRRVPRVGLGWADVVARVVVAALMLDPRVTPLALRRLRTLAGPRAVDFVFEGRRSRAPFGVRSSKGLGV